MVWSKTVWKASSVQSRARLAAFWKGSRGLSGNSSWPKHSSEGGHLAQYKPCRDSESKKQTTDYRRDGMERRRYCTEEFTHLRMNGSEVKSSGTLARRGAPFLHLFLPAGLASSSWSSLTSPRSASTSTHCTCSHTSSYSSRTVVASESIMTGKGKVR